MRFRSFALVAATAVSAVVLSALPASAGTGASQACGDHWGYQDIPVDNNVVTVGAALLYAPTESTNALIVCFSNTPYGYPSTGTGGALWIFYGNWGGTTSPDVHVRTYCDDDLGSQTVDLVNAPFSHCIYDNGITVSITPTTVVGSLPTCFIKVGSICSPATPPVDAPVPSVHVLVANIGFGV